MSDVLKGKTVLVTGAGRGIGRRIAEAFARNEASVIIHYGSDRDSASRAVEEIVATGGRAHLVQADLSHEGAVAELFRQVDSILGGAATLDVLVNNAGISMSGNVTSVNSGQFDRAFAVNTRAPLFVAQEAVRRMPDTGGRIINISSMVATSAYHGGAIIYGASKAALEYMTKSMAATLGPRRITVNAIAPGTTRTDFLGLALENEEFVERLKSETALHEIGDPRDIAEVALFLASDHSRWITGEIIHASGGALL